MDKKGYKKYPFFVFWEIQENCDSTVKLWGIQEKQKNLRKRFL